MPAVAKDKTAAATSAPSPPPLPDGPAGLGRTADNSANAHPEGGWPTATFGRAASPGEPGPPDAPPATDRSRSEE